MAHEELSHLASVPSSSLDRHAVVRRRWCLFYLTPSDRLPCAQNLRDLSPLWAELSSSLIEIISAWLSSSSMEITSAWLRATTLRDTCRFFSPSWVGNSDERQCRCRWSQGRSSNVTFSLAIADQTTAEPAANSQSRKNGTTEEPHQKLLFGIDLTGDTDDNSSDLDFARIQSQSKPVFRRPPFSRKIQQHKKITSLSRSSEVGNSQDVPPSVFLIST